MNAIPTPIVNRAIKFAAPDRSLPSSIDLESSILAAVMFDPENVAPACLELGLTVEHFYLRRHQAIYATALDLHRQGLAADLMQIATRLQQSGQLDQIGGQASLVAMLDNFVSAASLPSWVRKVIEDATRREGIRLLTDGIEQLYDPQTQPETVFEQSARSTYDLTQRSGQRYVMSPLSEVAAAAMAELDSQIDDTAASTELPDWDAVTGGFTPGYWLIAGRASMGKTQLALHFTRAMARTGGPVLFISCEMTKVKLFRRLLSREARIPATRLRDRQIAASEWETIGHAMAALAKLPIEIYDCPNPSETDLRQKINRISSTYGQPPKLIILDYIQKLRWGDSQVRAYELEAISNKLFEFHKDYNATVIALAQIGRGVESRTDKRPGMADLKDCGAFEQDADYVFTLYRDDYYNPSASTDRNVLEVGVQKARDSQTGTIKLLTDFAISDILPIHKTPPHDDDEDF
jgi:replicative DNA helicase